jgi:Protein of unknown function (DUF2628)
MTLYTVLAPAAPADARPDPLRLVFVKEGFCWPALFIPLLWLIFRRMWLILALYVAVSVGLRAATYAVGGAIPMVLFVLLSLLFAIEGNGLRRFTFEGAGYRLIDVAEGRRLEEAEIRFFLTHPVVSAVASAPTELAAPAWKPSEPAEVVGLFPTPGG